MKEIKLYGHARKGAVPALPGTVAKVCRKCDLWFAARRLERLCGLCVSRSSVRSKRAILGYDPRMALERAELPGDVHRKTLMGRVLCRELARGAARHADLGSKPWNQCAGWCTEGRCACTCHAWL